MNRLISVIIPVYNAENDILRCVGSILDQNYKNFELIIIDDGAKDRSGTLCDEISLYDNRVCVLHQSNKGAGAARNSGLSIAKGEYIVFVDSDDMIRNGYFEALSKHDEDVVFIDVDNIDSRGRLVKKEYMNSFRNLPKDEILRSQMTGKLPWGGVRKCVKRSLIEQNHISYSNHKIGEEAIYSYQVLRYAKTIGFIEQPVYCYMLHDNSLSNSKVDDPWGDVALALKGLVIECGDYPKYADTLNSFIYTAGAVSVYKMAQYYSFNLFIDKAKKRIAQMDASIDKEYKTDWMHISVKVRFLLWLMKYRCWFTIWVAIRAKR